MKTNILNAGYESNLRISKGKGQFLYDIKNKKLLDLSMCSGTMILGHSSKVFNNAINIQKKYGSLFGLPNNYSDKYSKTLKKIFPQYSKFILSSSGAEANIRAIRIARSLTNKDIIVMVSGSWHGSVDSLLFDLKDNKKKALSSGIAKFYKKNLIIIPYNKYIKSEKILKKYKSKIGLVIIEPIQQYLPTEISEKYIKQIFNFCRKNNILICFDEMITGMRIKHFSVQQKLKLNPDISTFGKIVGGGIPIGVTAISQKVDRKLKKKKIFLGGTYSANPLAAYIGLKTLEFILKNKDKFYKKINHLAKYFVKDLNYFLISNNFKIRVYNYYTMSRLVFSDKQIYNREERDNSEKKLKRKIAKFKKYVQGKNIIHPSTGAYFFSYAHELSDIKRLLKVFKTGIKKIF